MYNLSRLEITSIADETKVVPCRISFITALRYIVDEWLWSPMSHTQGVIPAPLANTWPLANRHRPDLILDPVVVHWQFCIFGEACQRIPACNPKAWPMPSAPAASGIAGRPFMQRIGKNMSSQQLVGISASPCVTKRR